MSCSESGLSDLSILDGFSCMSPSVSADSHCLYVEGRHFLNMSMCNCNFGSRLSAADEGSEVFIFLSAQFLHATVVWVIVLDAANTYFL